MDNIFEILIYLIIIFSFLSSFLKKKQPQKNTPVKTGSVSPDKKTTTKPGTFEEDYDILKEIENMFKKESASSETVPAEDKSGYNSSHYDAEWHKPVPDEHEHTDQWHEKTSSEHKRGDVWQKKSAVVESYKKSIDSKIKQEAEKFEQILKKRAFVNSKYAEEIIEDFRNPENLRKYFIASEILGKPKALRKG